MNDKWCLVLVDLYHPQTFEVTTSLVTGGCCLLLIRILIQRQTMKFRYDFFAYLQTTSWLSSNKGTEKSQHKFPNNHYACIE